MTFNPQSVSFNGPGNYLITVLEDGSLRVWNDQETIAQGVASGAPEMFERLNAHRDAMLQIKDKVGE